MKTMRKMDQPVLWSFGIVSSCFLFIFYLFLFFEVCNYIFWYVPLILTNRDKMRSLQAISPAMAAFPCTCWLKSMACIRFVNIHYCCTNCDNCFNSTRELAKVSQDGKPYCVRKAEMIAPQKFQTDLLFFPVHTCTGNTATENRQVALEAPVFKRPCCRQFWSVQCSACLLSAVWLKPRNTLIRVVPF